MPSLEEALGLDEEAAPTSGGRSLESALGLAAEPSVLSRIGKGISAGVRGLGRVVSDLPGDLLSAAQTVLPIVSAPITGNYQGAIDTIRERGPDYLRGAAQGLTFGLAPVSPENEEIARGGRFSGSTALGTGINKAVSPLVQKLVGALTPTLGRAASPLVRTAETAAVAGAPPAIVEGVSGGDPLEGFTSGMAAASLGHTIQTLSRKTARVAAAPAKQAIDKEALNQALEARRYMDWQQQMDELAAVKQRNASALEVYKEQLAEAQKKMATGESNATSNYEMALGNLRAAQKLQTDMETSLADRAKVLRPKQTPEEAYAEYNSARLVPETLPSIQLATSSGTLGRIGSTLSNATEGLPKAAGAQGTIEKLAAGLGEQFGETSGPKYHPDIVNYFGKAWKTLPEAKKMQKNAEYIAQLGISGDDIAQLSGGKPLRLDQADRILQLLGPNAETNGLASRIYWSLMEDLRASKDPMVKGFIDARAVNRQNIAASDVARMLKPVPDRFGRETLDSAALKKVTSMFRNYDRNPDTLTWQEKLLVESIPETQRAPLMQMINEIYKQRETVANVAATAKAAKPGKPQVEVVPKPKLEKEEIRSLPEALRLRDVPMEWTPGNMSTHQLDQSIYVGFRMLGMKIPGSIAAARSLGAVTRMIFKAGLTPAGREFVKTLWQNESPGINDLGKIAALANFVRTQDEQEQMRTQLERLQ